MFTGIIEELGKVISVSKIDKSMKLKVGCHKVTDNILIGDSVAVNGVCLTVTAFGSDYFEADISYETIDVTSLKNVKSGSYVNLERALTLSSRLGGHIVQGHVDGLGKILSITKYGSSYILKISYPSEISNYIVQKCSIAVDGISLTVAKMDSNSFEVAVIPHTFENTVLKYKNSGDTVNLESDILSRYVEKMLKNENKDNRLKEMILSFGSR